MMTFSKKQLKSMSKEDLLLYIRSDLRNYTHNYERLDLMVDIFNSMYDGEMMMVDRNELREVLIDREGLDLLSVLKMFVGVRLDYGYYIYDKSDRTIRGALVEELMKYVSEEVLMKLAEYRLEDTDTVFPEHSINNLIDDWLEAHLDDSELIEDADSTNTQPNDKDAEKSAITSPEGKDKKEEPHPIQYDDKSDYPDDLPYWFY